MKQPIENYASQIGVGNAKRRALSVWRVSVLTVFAWLFLILLAPFAAANNLQAVANPIYKFFSFLCHQIPARSFEFENQPLAVCARCFGIYCGLLGGLVAYPFFRSLENEQPLNRAWLFAAMIPMGADFSLGYFGIWANTHESRFFTGAILGAACAVFIVPALVELAGLARRKIKRPSNR